MIAKTPTVRRSDRRATSKAPSANPPPSTSGWNLQGLDFPLLRLLLVSKALERVNQRTIHRDANMTAAQWRVLSRLAPKGELTVKQIAELVWSDRAEVSRAANALKRQGLVTERENTGDRRAPLLFCTAKGLAAYEAIIPLRQKHYEVMVSGLSVKDIANFEIILSKLKSKVQEFDDFG